MSPDEAALHRDAQRLLSDAELAEYFSVPRLRAWQPPVGARGVDPVLRLCHLPKLRGRLQEHDLRLPGLRFDLVDERPELMRELGERAANDGVQAVLILLRSEAWLRAFTPEEKAARQGRLVETYPDKEEAMIISGLTIDGRSRLARASMQRRASGRLQGIGAWQVSAAEDTVRMYLLEHFFEAYLQVIATR